MKREDLRNITKSQRLRQFVDQLYQRKTEEKLPPTQMQLGDRDPQTGKDKIIYQDGGSEIAGKRIFKSSPPVGSLLQSFRPDGDSIIALNYKNSPQEEEADRTKPIKTEVFVDNVFVVYEVPSTEGTVKIYSRNRGEAVELLELDASEPRDVVVAQHEGSFYVFIKTGHVYPFEVDLELGEVILYCLTDVGTSGFRYLYCSEGNDALFNVKLDPLWHYYYRFDQNGSLLSLESVEADRSLLPDYFSLLFFRIEEDGSESAIDVSEFYDVSTFNQDFAYRRILDTYHRPQQGFSEGDLTCWLRPSNYPNPEDLIVIYIEDPKTGEPVLAIENEQKEAALKRYQNFVNILGEQMIYVEPYGPDASLSEAIKSSNISKNVSTYQLDLQQTLSSSTECLVTSIGTAAINAAQIPDNATLLILKQLIAS